MSFCGAITHCSGVLAASSRLLSARHPPCRISFPQGQAERPLCAAVAFCGHVPQPVTEFYLISLSKSPFFCFQTTTRTFFNVWSTIWTRIMKWNTSNIRICLTHCPNQTSSTYLVPSASPKADDKAKVAKADWTTLACTHHGPEFGDTSIFLPPDYQQIGSSLFSTFKIPNKYLRVRLWFTKYFWMGVRSFWMQFKKLRTYKAFCSFSWRVYPIPALPLFCFSNIYLRVLWACSTTTWPLGEWHGGLPTNEKSQPSMWM